MIRKTERFLLIVSGILFICISGFLLIHIPDAAGTARLQGVIIALFIAVFGVGFAYTAMFKY